MTDPWEHAKDLVEKAWSISSRESDFRPDQALRATLDEVFQQLDQGVLRVASQEKNGWVIHPWIKKAILLFFRFSSSRIDQGAGQAFFDKIPLKTRHWTQETFEAQGFRMVTGAVVRRSVYIAPRSVLMPCFINVGAYIGEKTMIESMTTIGSCVQIGQRCHIAEGVCLGGMLEPIASHPVIIEDDCFIGARCSITESVIIEHGSVFGPGVHVSASTKIYDAATGVVSYGRIPPYSVVVGGTIPDTRGIHMQAAIITRTIDAKIRAQTLMSDLFTATS